MNLILKLKLMRVYFKFLTLLADLNKLEIIFLRYFRIYKKIIDKIQFDYLRIENYNPSIKGKLNWTRTLTRINF